MGKSTNGIFGNWWGRTGNIVGRVRQGRTILSVYQPNVANPQTNAQMATRMRFTSLTRAFSALSSVVRLGFRDLDGYEHGTYFSAAVGYNMRRDGLFTGTYPSLSLNYSLLAISQGAIDLPFTPTANADSGTLSAIWSDNSGLGNALGDDTIYVVAYNNNTNESVFVTALRSARNVDLTFPTAWGSQDAYAYMFVYRADKGVASPTAYLGKFTA